MLNTKIIDVIGEVFVDVLQYGKDRIVRPGGVAHAARGLQAVKACYGLHAWVPIYLNDQVSRFAANCRFPIKTLGLVTGAPNIVLVPDPSEAGHQGYDEILRDQWCQSDVKRYCPSRGVTDILIFPGRYDLRSVVDALPSGTKLHIDLHYNINTLSSLRGLSKDIETAILSTSSDLFRNTFGEDVSKAVAELIGMGARKVLMKENRGGARLFRDDGKVLETPAFLGSAIHSVGVGDCFDSVFVGHWSENDEIRLRFASMVAAAYASSLNDEVFLRQARQLLMTSEENLLLHEGVCLPWDARPDIAIYMAFPDFDDVDHTGFDAVLKALRYHNFNGIIRPVQDHGVVCCNDHKHRRREVFEADCGALRNADLTIAVLPFDDPGTLIEIGLAGAWGVPVILHDVSGSASNLMLTETPVKLTHSLNELIDQVFVVASTRRRHKKEASQ